jgi:pentapeptide repeat protein
MGDSKGPQTGRRPFEMRAADRDYSGLTIVDRYLQDASLEKSFFNGATLANTWFSTVALNNVEFCEAKIERTHFECVNLTGSDFVDSVLEHVTFSYCSFEKGEWRDTAFRECIFIHCTFSHTTVSLCTFTACSFDKQTIGTIQDRAAYYNAFSFCAFSSDFDDGVFVSRNFGIPAAPTMGTSTSAESQPDIERMCLLNNLGQFRVVSLADVATSICGSFRGAGSRRSSSLIFFSKIVTILTNERRISATSLLYLEQLITGFGSEIDDRDLLMAAMDAVLEIHSALLVISTEASNFPNRPEHAVRQLVIHFPESYGWRDIEVFRKALALASGTNSEVLEIRDVRPGSTIAEMASTALLTTGALLTGLTFVLRQARVAVDQATQLKRSIDTFKKTPRPRKKRTSLSLAIPASSKVEAILQPENAVPELKRLSALTRENGRALMELDERADVRILTETVD